MNRLSPHTDPADNNNVSQHKFPCFFLLRLNNAPLSCTIINWEAVGEKWRLINIALSVTLDLGKAWRKVRDKLSAELITRTPTHTHTETRTKPRLTACLASLFRAGKLPVVFVAKRANDKWSVT